MIHLYHSIVFPFPLYLVFVFNPSNYGPSCLLSGFVCLVHLIGREGEGGKEGEKKRGIHYVAHSSPELNDFLLNLPSPWITGVCHHALQQAF